MFDDNKCLKEFGQFIREGREKKNLYQRHVAEKLGTTQQYYSRIEKGQRNVDLVLAVKICQILNLNLSSFIRTYFK